MLRNSQRIAIRTLALAVGVLQCSVPTAVDADILRTDGTSIPGTAEITVGPGLNLREVDLEAADFSSRNITGSYFDSTNLTNATFANSDLSDSWFYCHNTLTGADFTNAVIDRVWINGISPEQLYATANYRRGDLRGTTFSEEECVGDLRGWDLSGKDLTGVSFEAALMDETDLSNSNLSEAKFISTLAGHTNFENAQFTNADVEEGIFTGANFAGSEFRGTHAVSSGFEHANFRGADLSGAVFLLSRLTGADFKDAVLTASFQESNLTNADFTNAVLRDAGIFSSRGFTKEQLYSTASYTQKDLRGFKLSAEQFPGNDDFVSTDLSGQNLDNAKLDSLKLRDSTLANASLRHAELTSLDLTNVDARGVDLRASYVSDSTLEGTDLRGARLETTDISRQNLDNAVFDVNTRYDQWTEFPVGFDPQAAGLTLVSSPTGDLTADSLVDIVDLDALSCRIAGCGPRFVPSLRANSRSQERASDLNADGRISDADLTYFIEEVSPTWPGDANFDNGFNSSDLVTVFMAGQYEDGVRRNSTWSTGDWNADGEFDSRDLVVAFSAGGYDQGPRGDDVQAVPEPQSSAPMIFFLGLLTFRASIARSEKG